MTHTRQYTAKHKQKGRREREKKEGERAETRRNDRDEAAAPSPSPAASAFADAVLAQRGRAHPTHFSKVRSAWGISRYVLKPLSSVVEAAAAPSSAAMAARPLLVSLCVSPLYVRLLRGTGGKAEG